MDTTVQRKARGAFFTPPEISRYLVDWAVRSATDSVLEPSCGEASFLLRAGEKLRDCGASSRANADQLHGVEIHATSAVAAHALLASNDLSATIHVGDFFEQRPTHFYDALIGNPPYVRYQQHSGDARAKSLEAALIQGVRLNGLASSWAAFVVHAASFLKPDGRLGLVLPAELLTVKYAAEVRSFLLRHFAKVRLVMFDDLVFPGVLEEVVLLLAEGSGGASCFEVYQTRDLSTLETVEAASWSAHEPEAGEKWTPALLAPSLFSTYQKASKSDGFSQLKDWGQTFLGAVTGSNSYFTLTASDLVRLGLSRKDVVPISPPGSRHLKGLKLSRSAWEAMLKAGARGWLFMPPTPPSEPAARYIEHGEALEVDGAYKCTVRSPWWRVPLVAIPDLFLTYMDHDRPRLVTNEARLNVLNSLYGVTLHPGRKAIGTELLPVAALNSVTLMGSEVVGRAYGGGLLKVEPREADLLPMPSFSLLKDAQNDLRAIEPQVAGALRKGNLAGAVELVDSVLLTKHLELPQVDLLALKAGRELLFQRRLSRGRGTRVEN